MFPKQKKRKKKSRREIDNNYVRWVHGWECVVPYCEKRYPVHAHHVKTRGTLGSDRTCLPLCADHHVGNSGVHTVGVITFQKKHNIDFDALVEEFNRRFDNGIVGPKHHLVEKRKN